MVRVLYCWRCRMDVPMLEGHEAAYVLSGRRDRSRIRILTRYHELTSFRETNPNAVWHHVAELYGPACTSCAKPLRTPRARICAACGAPRGEAITETG